VATSSLTVVDGFHQAWDGDLLMGTLKDQSLHRIRLQDGHVMFDERIPVGKRIREVHQHDDGRIVLWTDDKYLIFLTISENSFVAEFIEDYLNNAAEGKPDANGLRVALGTCMECHSFEPGDDLNAPSLARVFDAPTGATGYGAYSEALKSLHGRWSREELIAFIRDPAGYAPGTVMPDPGIDDDETLGELVDLMDALRNNAE
jgi:cytochrome c2